MLAHQFGVGWLPGRGRLGWLVLGDDALGVGYGDPFASLRPFDYHRHGRVRHRWRGQQAQHRLAQIRNYFGFRYKLCSDIHQRLCCPVSHVEFCLQPLAPLAMGQAVLDGHQMAPGCHHRVVGAPLVALDLDGMLPHGCRLVAQLAVVVAQRGTDLIAFGLC